LPRFFTIHGSADEIIPVEDAYEFAKLISNHKLRVIEGANHCYTAHRRELSDAVVEAITSSEVYIDKQQLTSMLGMCFSNDN